MKFGREHVVYLFGVLLLGVAYATVKNAIDNDLLFVTLVVGYLLVLRLVGSAVMRRNTGCTGR